MLKYLILIFFLYTNTICVFKSEKNECAPTKSLCNHNLEQACCAENSTCKLVMDYFVCTEIKKLGDSCSSDQDCFAILHGFCLNNKCECRLGNREVNKTCVPLLGEFCWKNEECFDDNSDCINNSCQCSAGFIKTNNKCIPSSSEVMRVSCDNSNQCSVKNSVCIDNKCQCKPNYLLIDGNECRKVRIGMDCHESFKCDNFIDNSVCLNNKCLCNVDYLPTERGCAPKVGVHCKEFCASSYLECINNVCQCKENYELKNGACVKRVYLHDQCSSQSDCDGIKYGLCGDNGRCTCRNNYLPKNTSVCAPGLGGYCFESENCIVENSVCIDNRCQCESLMKSSDGKCPEIDKLGQSCEADYDCRYIKNSICSLEKCICKENYSAFNKSACGPNFQEFCSVDQDCLFQNFHCFNNKCQCKANFVSVSATQCIDREFVFICHQGLDCSDPWHSMCSEDYRCVCRENNMAVGRACLPLLHGYCWRNDQCLAENSECFDFRCQCKYKFTEVAGNLCVIE